MLWKRAVFLSLSSLFELCFPSLYISLGYVQVIPHFHKKDSWFELFSIFPRGNIRGLLVADLILRILPRIHQNCPFRV